VAAGFITPAMLRGPRYQRIFPDVYAPAALEADLAVRARAAGVLVAGRGVVAGYAAAELLGASNGPADALVDVLMPHAYRCDGLVVHRTGLGPGELTSVGPTAVTTAARMAFDLARWAPTLTERVTGVDALAFNRAVDPEEVRVLRNRHLGVRHGSRVAPVLALVNPDAQSPMESRTRMAMHLGGLPAPAVQHLVIARGARYYPTWPTPRSGSRSSTTAPTTARSNVRAAISSGRRR